MHTSKSSPVATRTTEQPNNRNIQPKIRQTLQHLRRTGEVSFVDNRGNYLRLHTVRDPVQVESNSASGPFDHETGVPDSVPLEARAPDAYIVTRSDAYEVNERELELSTAWERELKSRRHDTHRWLLPTESNSRLYTDLYDASANVLYEVKSNSTRETIRLAIGQLFDYRRYLTFVAPGFHCSCPIGPPRT
jgi:hypothetical protein